MLRLEEQINQCRCDIMSKFGSAIESSLKRLLNDIESGKPPKVAFNPKLGMKACKFIDQNKYNDLFPLVLDQFVGLPFMTFRLGYTYSNQFFSFNDDNPKHYFQYIIALSCYEDETDCPLYIEVEKDNLGSQVAHLSYLLSDLFWNEYSFYFEALVYAKILIATQNTYAMNEGMLLEERNITLSDRFNTNTKLAVEELRMHAQIAIGTAYEPKIPTSPSAFSEPIVLTQDDFLNAGELMVDYEKYYDKYKGKP